MARSSTSFKPGNTAAKGRTQPLAQVIAEAFDEAAIGLVNDKRRAAHRRLAKTDPDMADQLFKPTTDANEARVAMIKQLGKMAAHDKTANKLFWDRYQPKPKMPLVKLDESIVDMPPDQAASIIAEMVAAGAMTSDQGESMIRVFSGAAQIREAEANTRLMNAMADEEEAAAKGNK